MKALEKDRARRYQTANALAADIERYLHDEPVEASPPTASYRLRKLAMRHRAAVITSAAFVSLLIAAVVVSASFAFREKSARELADRNAALAAQNAQQATRETDNAQKARLAALAQQKRADEARTARRGRETTGRSECKTGGTRGQRGRFGEIASRREGARGRPETPGRRPAETTGRTSLAAGGLATYAKHLAAAWREIDENNPIAAGRELDACDWDLRGWEHHYLWGLLERQLPSKIAPADQHAQFSADGKLWRAWRS